MVDLLQSSMSKYDLFPEAYVFAGRLSYVDAKHTLPEGTKEWIAENADEDDPELYLAMYSEDDIYLARDVQNGSCFGCNEEIYPNPFICFTIDEEDRFLHPNCALHLSMDLMKQITFLEEEIVVTVQVVQKTDKEQT